MDLLNFLREDHRRLLGQVEEFEKILAGLTEPPSPNALNAVREVLRRLTELLQSHGQKEKAELFPALKTRLPEADQWWVGMLDVEDEMILSKARRLSDPSLPMERIREGGGRLVRLVREHITNEEERLFPRLEAQPPSEAPPPKISLWARLRALFKRR